MSIVNHAQFDGPQPQASPVKRPSEQLFQVMAGIDGCFTDVGTRLGEAVGAIDAIIASLRDVASVFDHGDAARAVDNLQGAARRLLEVSSLVDQRGADVADIREASGRLRADANDMQKCLEVLQIYGMNVKIAASGEADFVGFADSMRATLTDGEKHTKDFALKLDALQENIVGMLRFDKLLIEECQRVVPAVPNRLIEDADDLRAHQGRLAELARTTAEMASSIQALVGAALIAIQIGDRTRQRLEHVVTGLALLDAHEAGETGDPAAKAATLGHFGQLLGDLCAGAAVEYRQETEALVAALRRLRPNVESLIGLQRRDGDKDEKMFLRRLEEGVGSAADMIEQLCRSDMQADRTLAAIIDTATSISERAAAIRHLRVDIQQMAINIGLRCRKVGTVGRPVAVIANEIRGLSDHIHTIIDRIGSAEKALSDVSVRMGAQSQDRDSNATYDLTGSLSAIRQSADRTEGAISSVEQTSGGVLDALHEAADMLEASLRSSDLIHQISEQIAQRHGDAGPEAAEGAIAGLMEALAGCYTMAEERTIHNRFLLPGMEPLGQEPTGSSIGDDDDDAFFDDALF